MNNKRKKTSIIFLVLIVSFLAIFSFGFLIGKNTVKCDTCSPQDLNFSLFWKSLETLKQNYVNPEDINYQNLIYGAISGMVKSLNDPYTVFMNPDDSKRFLEDVSGEFEGVGMEIGIKEGKLQVIAPLEGTPAQKAGLLAGDKIIKINDNFTSDITIEEAVDKIRGPKGSVITLTILRDGWSSPKDFKIKRAIIEIPSLKWELKDKDIAYIDIYQFSEKSEYDFRKTAINILNSPAKRIILDLRNNPGGYLEVSRYIAGWFLKRGDIVTIEDFGGKEKNKEYKSYGNEAFLNYPVVVLINKGSASASEILASALRDNRDIKLIGETSFGKGSVQQLFSLPDGSNLKITVAKWLTPKGKSINGKGLKPDIEVKMSEKDYNEGKDPQLDKAIKVIKSL